MGGIENYVLQIWFIFVQNLLFAMLLKQTAEVEQPAEDGSEMVPDLNQDNDEPGKTTSAIQVILE